MEFEIIDSRTVRDEDGRDHDVLKAMESLPWVHQLCPLMPHDYVHQTKVDPLAYAVVERMLRADNPESYKAYFRGHLSPIRYWEALDGRRYWMTRLMINRCDPESVEPLRRCDEGAKAVTDWAGPRNAPNGSGLYGLDTNGRWWPTEAAIAAGFKPCAGCTKKSPVEWAQA